jgi:hypothetical protein
MTCDRCGAGIATVHAVDFKDGSRQVFGTDCIEKILAGDTSLRGLYRKQVKNVARLNRALDALRLGDAAPRGNEYYGSGMFFVTDSTGEAIVWGSGSLWHPTMDAEKNQGGTSYRLDGKSFYFPWVGRQDNTPENFTLRARSSMARAIPEIEAEVAKIESFLGRIVAKGLVTPEKAA